MQRTTLLGLAILAAGAGLVAACGDDAPAPAADGGNVGKGGSAIGHPGGEGPDVVDQGGAGAQGGAPIAADAGVAATLAGATQAEGGAPFSVCNEGKGATISGRVLAPNAELPVPGVAVYVPSGSVDPLPYGATCWRCDGALRGDPVAVAHTDADGRFELVNVPVGESVRLVVQTGKWQRQTEVASVVDCQDNPVEDDDVRLPASRSEGGMPRIALVSGAEDTLECLLLKLGIAEDEFTFASGAGRVRLFSGKGGMTELDGVVDSTLPLATTLWSDPELLGDFDLVLLGSETDANAADKPEQALTALHDYAAHGGRVLLQHHQGYFLQNGPSDVSGLATFAAPALPDPYTASVDTKSARGKQMSSWLDLVDAGGQAGKLVVHEGVAGVSAIKAPAVRLLHGETPTSVQAFSVDLPYEGDAEVCGRISATDLLTASTDVVAAFPAGCTSTELNAQELALAYLIFDLGECL